MAKLVEDTVGVLVGSRLVTQHSELLVDLVQPAQHSVQLFWLIGGVGAEGRAKDVVRLDLAGGVRRSERGMQPYVRPQRRRYAGSVRTQAFVTHLQATHGELCSVCLAVTTPVHSGYQTLGVRQLGGPGASCRWCLVWHELERRPSQHFVGACAGFALVRWHAGGQTALRASGSQGQRHGDALWGRAGVVVWVRQQHGGFVEAPNLRCHTATDAGKHSSHGVVCILV